MAALPTDGSRYSMKWDGEWQVTYETFRDMGAAFMVALLGIYILVVAQFGSFKLPLVILLSAVVGSVVGIAMIVFGGRSSQTQIPFGPYLAAAGWIALLWGERLVHAYEAFFAR